MIYCTNPLVYPRETYIPLHFCQAPVGAVAAADASAENGMPTVTIRKPARRGFAGGEEEGEENSDVP